MKKNRCQSALLFFSLILLLFFAGCISDNRNNEEFENNEDSPGEQRGPAPQGDPQWFLNGVSYDEESLRELIGYFPNLIASENLYFEIPEKCRLYRYGIEAPKDRNNRSYSEEFYEAFHFFFPEHVLDENYLYYSDMVSSMETNEGGLNLLKDHKEEVLADKYGVAHFEYDERAKRGSAPGEPCVQLELGNPIGYGYAYVSKGKAVEIMATAPGREIYPGVYSEDPGVVFPTVDYYSPKSEKSFRLADKEVKIRDAVAFYENYMSELPFPKESDMEEKVKDVCVLEIGEGQYAYHFVTAGTFGGVPLDYTGRATNTSSSLGYYITTVGSALMLESGDIDIINNFRKKQSPHDLVEIREGISLEKALALLSESLTDHVDFELERIEIVYRSQYIPDENGYINIVTYAQELAPWWKFALYNANDSLTYMFYVDAADGKLVYHTTRNRLYLLK